MGHIATPDSQPFAVRRKNGRDRALPATLALCLHLLVLWGVIHGFGGVPAITEPHANDARTRRCIRRGRPQGEGQARRCPRSASIASRARAASRVHRQ
jgi:hypothetical protein